MILCADLFCKEKKKGGGGCRNKTQFSGYVSGGIILKEGFYHGRCSAISPSLVRTGRHLGNNHRLGTYFPHHDRVLRRWRRLLQNYGRQHLQLGLLQDRQALGEPRQKHHRPGLSFRLLYHCLLHRRQDDENRSRQIRRRLRRAFHHLRIHYRPRLQRVPEVLAA